MDLDIEYVRKQFPAFDVPDLINKGFFENAGGSYVCRQVINRLNRFYTEKKVQPYGALQARQNIQQFLHKPLFERDQDPRA